MRAQFTCRLSLITLALLTCLLAPVAEAAATTLTYSDVTVPSLQSYCGVVVYAAASFTGTGSCNTDARFSIWWAPQFGSPLQKLTYVKDVTSFNQTFDLSGYFQTCVYNGGSEPIVCTLTETY
ncbi:MAG TPA: hypothetical protein VKY89_25030 [Thermoanaerobaculia bacterium]|jgi:hypothetical protein|nr:hypothetical protein [Thermoanaerobaculia bacterium]